MSGQFARPGIFSMMPRRCFCRRRCLAANPNCAETFWYPADLVRFADEREGLVGHVRRSTRRGRLGQSQVLGSAYRFDKYFRAPVHKQCG